MFSSINIAFKKKKKYEHSWGERGHGRAGNRVGRVNSRLGQNRAGPKLAQIFRTKILAAQPALKTGMVGPNSLLKAKTILTGRAGSGQIWSGFFQANNLMAQLGPNSG